MSDSTGSLERFIQAQNGLYDEIVRELRDWKKAGHWMWYVFPQIAGLGQSATAKFYAIQDTGEAHRHVLPPILGERLLECTKIVLSLKNKSALEIFGDIDAMKFRSSMTLFVSLAGSDSVYQHAIDKYFDGAPDQRAQNMLSKLQG